MQISLKVGQQQKKTKLCDFSGGSGPPVPPSSGSAYGFSVNLVVQVHIFGLIVLMKTKRAHCLELDSSCC